jgi:hypothetical protein
MGFAGVRLSQWIQGRACLVVVSLLVLIGGLAPEASAGSITLAWDASPTPGVTGYLVRYRSEDNLETGVRAFGPVTTAVVTSLRGGQRYFLTVAAFNSMGLVSAPSNEVNGLASDDGTGPPPPEPPSEPPPDATQSYFAEGAQGFFSYRLAFLNTTTKTTTVAVSYLREGDSPVNRRYAVQAQSRATALAEDVPQIANTSFAAVVTAAPGVFTERTMRWRLGDADGAHSAKAMNETSTHWYLAEGNAGYFDTFVLLANPNQVPTAVTVDFLLDDASVVRRTYTVPGDGRYTIWASQIPELVSKSFGTTITSSLPIIVERAMYFGGPHGAFEGGHASAAVKEGARDWFLAEGSTGSWFDTFVLISNPNASDVTATIRYLTPSGLARTDTRTLPSHSRATIQVDSLEGLESTEVSCWITADAPIIVERSMYWPGAPWYGGHNSVGVTALNTRWALAEGEVGGVDGADTFVLLANPGTSSANVTLSYYRTRGAPVQVSRTVEPGSRVTVSASSVGLSDGERFGIVVDSTQPIAVERSIYWNYKGSLWSSGTNETAIPRP